MKKMIPASLPLVLLATLLALATGCNSDDSVVYTTTNDCFMKSVTLGKLKRTIHTKDSKGQDSTYVTPVTGSYYPLFIDQQEERIYNADSLPKGTDTRHVVFSSISASGTVAIRSLTTGLDTLFTATDSTDFSTERLVTVYGTDGTTQRSYRMKVNVHREEADSFRWTRIATAEPLVAALGRLHVVARGQNLYVFGTEGAQPVMLTTDRKAPATWTRTALTTDLDVSSIRLFNGEFFALAGGEVVRSADGLTWVATGANLRPDLMAAAGTQILTAVKGDRIYSSPDGITWTEDAADAPQKLPATNADGICLTSATDAAFEDLLLVGQRDGEAVVWKRNIDKTPNGDSYPWTYYPPVENSRFNCPLTEGMTLMPYDGATVLVGRDATTGKALLRLSRDNGRSWRTNEFDAPAGAAPLTAVAATADEDHCIWLVCGGSGEVWRGRLNRLGWQDEETSFLKSRQR